MEHTLRQRRVLELLEKNLTPKTITVPTLPASVEAAATSLKKFGTVINVSAEQIDQQMQIFAKIFGEVNGNQKGATYERDSIPF